MTSNQKTALKIIMWSILLHVALIALTILEVFIYSMAVNPGQDNRVYEQHAQQSGPYVGILAGFVFVYFVTVWLKRKTLQGDRLICFGLPVGYIILDVLILVLSGTDWMNHLTLFSISYSTKVFAGYLALKTK